MLIFDCLLKNEIQDKDLIESLQKGNLRAFDHLFEKYSKRLFSFGYKYLKSKEDAEGLVQRVFLKVWDNRQSLKKDESFNAFIFTIAYNDVCNVYRSRVREKNLKEKLILDIGETRFTTEPGSDYKSALELVMGIILQLPEKQRMAFMKSRFEGLSSKEIARELQLSPGTVDNYISAALKFIKTRMGNENLAFLLFLHLWLM